MKIYDEKGFTLVEVMVSMMIFAIGILAIINMQIISTKTNSKSRGITEAMVVAQNKIEELSGLPYNNDDLVDLDVADPNGGLGQAGLDDFPVNDTVINVADHTDNSNPLYTVYWNVWDDAPFLNTKTVRVIVRWSEKGVFYNYPVDVVIANGT